MTKKKKHCWEYINWRNLSETKISSYMLLYIYTEYTEVVTNLKAKWKMIKSLYRVVC